MMGKGVTVCGPSLNNERKVIGAAYCMKKMNEKKLL